MDKATASPASTAPREMIAQLLKAEDARRTALVEDDTAAFAALQADDIVHAHTTGSVHSRDELLHHTGTFLTFYAVKRGELTIRALGADAAVMTGEMINVVGKRGTDEKIEVNAFVTQIWRREAAVWKIASFQATRLS